MGLVRKDIYLVLGMGKYYLAMLLLFGVLSLTGVYNLSFYASICTMLVVTLPFSVFAYDEQAGWDKYAVSTPAGRRGVVRGKYVFALLIWVVVLVTVVLFFGGAALVKQEGVADNLMVGITILGGGLVMLDILLPLLFKFGTQKSRLMLMLVIGVAVGVSVGLAGVLSDSVGGDVQSLMGLVTVLLPIIGLGGMVISYMTALSIYLKKEL